MTTSYNGPRNSAAFEKRDALVVKEAAHELQLQELYAEIGLLAERLIAATDWLTQHPDTRLIARWSQTFRRFFRLKPRL